MYAGLPCVCGTSYLYRGALKYHVKLFPAAIDDLNTAISLDPAHSALAFFNRALCYQATGSLHQVKIAISFSLPPLTIIINFASACTCICICSPIVKARHLFRWLCLLLDRDVFA